MTPTASTDADAIFSDPTLAQILNPVSPQQACGESLDYDPEHAVLQSRLRPKAEIQYGKFTRKPDMPEWAEIERDCRRLLLRSKDISVLIWFLRARVRQIGANGLHQGLRALLMTLETFPDDVHPQIVQEGEADPAVRANALAALADPEGLLGDIRDIVLSTNVAARLTMRDVERAFAVPRMPDALEAEAVTRQLMDMQARGDGALRALHAAAECLNKIVSWCQQTLQDHTPDLTALTRLLGMLKAANPAPTAEACAVRDPETNSDAEDHLSLHNAARLPAASQAPHLGAGLEEPAASVASDKALQRPTLPLAEQREKIRETLMAVRLWVESNEPSSPVATLLKQAERLWGKRYSEVAHALPAELLRQWEQDQE